MLVCQRGGWATADRNLFETMKRPPPSSTRQLPTVAPVADLTTDPWGCALQTLLSPFQALVNGLQKAKSSTKGLAGHPGSSLWLSAHPHWTPPTPTGRPRVGGRTLLKPSWSHTWLQGRDPAPPLSPSCSRPTRCDALPKVSPPPRSLPNPLSWL